MAGLLLPRAVWAEEPIPQAWYESLDERLAQHAESIGKTQCWLLADNRVSGRLETSWYHLKYEGALVYLTNGKVLAQEAAGGKLRIDATAAKPTKIVSFNFNEPVEVACK